MRRMGIVAATALTGLATGPAMAQEAPAALLAAACTSCHGVDGRSETAIPPLAGRPDGELVAVLTAFRSGEQPSTIMGRIAKGYSDAEIAAIAAYFAGL